MHTVRERTANRFVALLMLGVASTAPAVQLSVVPVEVMADTHDPQGERLNSRFTEAIRKSASFEVSEHRGPRLIVMLETMDVPPPYNGQATIFAFDFLWQPGGSMAVFLKQGLGTCDAASMDTCVDKLMSGLQAQFDFAIKASAHPGK